MNKILEHMRSLLENGKFLSFFLVSVLTFALIGDTRRYVFDSICSAQTFAGIGADWVNITALFACFAVVGVAVGLIVLYLVSKKLTFRTVSTVDGIAGAISLLILVFTPKILGLTAKSASVQTLAVASTFVILFLSTVATATAVFSLGAHVLIVVRYDSRYAANVVAAGMILAVLPAVVVASLGASYRLFIGIVGGLTVLLAILNGIFEKKTTLWEDGSVACGKTGKICFAFILVAAIAVIVSLAATVEYFVKL